ncbi:MAG: DUF4166 domain-containing protein [Rhizobiaceae bacterium]
MRRSTTREGSCPETVREMHRVCADGGASGEAIVKRGHGPAARFIAWVVRFPTAGRHPLHVAFTERDGLETWTREFGPYCFTSRLSERDGRLVERFGPLQFRFDLPSDDKGLVMEMRGWSCFGVPLPMALAPRSRAREWQKDGRFRFDVLVALPIVGPIVRDS